MDAELRSRRVGYEVLAVVLLSCGVGRAQDLYVQARTGCDANPGTAPGAPLQTITRALVIAATPPVVARTIRVAGAFAAGARIPYDDVANPFNPGCGTPAPQGVETFPLVMVSQVSLAWETPISDDTDPGPAFVPARPLIRTGVPLISTLLSFGATYTPGAIPANVTSFDFEVGSPSAVLIPSGPSGTVRPTLRDVKVFDSLTGVSVTTAAAPQKVTPTIVDGEFAVRSAAPASGLLLIDVAASGGGVANAVVENSSFRAEPPQAAQAGVRLTATAGGSIDLTLRNSFIDGGDLLTPAGQGLGRGVQMTTVTAAVATTIKATITGSTFEHCESGAVQFQALARAVPNATSTVTVSGDLFKENHRVTTAAPSISPGGDVEIEAEGGNRVSALISGNTIAGSDTRGRSGIYVGNSNSGSPIAMSPAYIVATIEQNSIGKPFWHGIFLDAASLEITGSVARNTILDPGGHGIFNRATSSYYSSTTSPDVTNNIIGYAGNNASGFLGDGIRNEATAPGVAPVIATPRIVHTTVSNATGFALNNVFPAGYPQAFSVTNSIFRNGTGFDIVDGTAGTYPFPNMVVTFCNFFSPTPTNPLTNNNNFAPSFVSPSSRNFHLASGSALVDIATVTPPVVPRVDIDGNARQIDVGPPSPPATIADMGADERTTP